MSCASSYFTYIMYYSRVATMTTFYFYLRARSYRRDSHATSNFVIELPSSPFYSS